MMQIMEAKKMSPELRFKEFNVPWVEKHLVDSLSEIIDYRGKPPPKSETGVPLITAKNVRQGYLDFTVKEYILDEDYSSWMCRGIPQSGDVLFTTEAPLGNVCMFPDSGKYALGQRTLTLRVEENNYGKFLFHLLLTPKNQERIDKNSTGSTAKGIKSSTFKKMKFSFPVKVEQKKISRFLTAVDEKLNQLRRKRDYLETYKRGVMQKIFSQEIRFTQDDGSAFPEWEEKELGDVLAYEQPTNYLVSSTEYDDKFKIPVLTAGKTFILGYTDEQDGIFSKDLPVIIFDDFTTAKQFVNFPFKAKSSAMKILKRVDEKTEIKVIYEFMKLLKFSLGEHKRYWISEYSLLAIPYPSSEEQQKIADFLSAMDKKIDRVNQQIDQTETFKKGLLQKMFV